MRQGTRVFSIAVLAVLIVLNLLLLFLLFRPDVVLTARSTDQDPGNSGSPTAILWPATTSPSSASGDQTTSPGPDASTDPTPSTRRIQPVPVGRLLLAMSSKTGWRATVGDCNTPGTVERSTNGGASWKRIARTGPAPIVRLGAAPGDDIFTIGGAGHSCSARYMVYATDGTATASSTSLANVWYPTPGDRDEINGPDGAQATPCKGGHVIGLAPLKSSQALVICDDGAAMSTRNSGKTWRQVTQIPNTLAITAGRGRYWAAGVQENCDGVAVQSLTEENASLTGARCAPGLDVAAGQVAIDVTGGTIWLWSGSKVAISTDDGETWK
jgi:hypothetical protein